MNTQKIRKIICNVLDLDSAPNIRKLREYKDITEADIQSLAFAIRNEFKIDIDKFYECETVGDVIDFVCKQSKLVSKKNVWHNAFQRSVFSVNHKSEWKLINLTK